MVDRIELLGQEIRSGRQVLSHADRQVAALIMKSGGNPRAALPWIDGTTFGGIAGAVLSISTLPHIYDSSAARDSLHNASLQLMTEIAATADGLYVLPNSAL
ncbi:hypothetical protein [Streptomyces sp. SAS_275]|uniref:hypothetical protein n=1 Tax=Streptomyces sp. SAS_275 TaxID=3412746 RepID=UPI00403D5338